MAAPTLCEPCLDGRHRLCINEQEMLPVDEEICGGIFCVCGHGEQENKWQKSVREKALNKLAMDDGVFT